MGRRRNKTVRVDNHGEYQSLLKKHLEASAKLEEKIREGEELKRQIEERDSRIEELETIVKEKDGKIGRLRRQEFRPF